jgi:tungstate transport system ATP-binding protein
MAAGPPVYRLDGVRQAYAGRTVLDIEQLEVREGEVLGLVGPSGAGKSTLLRLLNFLESPASGRLLYREMACQGSATALEVRRQVTSVFQRPVLQRASVWSNVCYGLRLRGLQPDGQVGAILRTVGLEELTRAPARQLSGGEMQRVALARALVIHPRVLLLDEPTANLDPYNVSLIEQIIRSENAERGTTVILVTHNVFQAHRLAHRTGLLLAGRLVELAGTESFFSTPSDPRTAAFVSGEMVY